MTNSRHQSLLSAWTHKASEGIKWILSARRVGMLFLSLSDQAGGITGWLTDRLEEGLVQAWQRLAAGRVRKMVSRRLMCHPQWGRYKGVSLPIWQHLSKWRAFTNLTPCAEGWEKHGVADVRLTEKQGEFVAHTHTLNKQHFSRFFTIEAKNLFFKTCSQLN